jgi:hypothetical protein
MKIKVDGEVYRRILEFYKNAKKSHPNLNIRKQVKEVYAYAKKIGTNTFAKTNITLRNWGRNGYTVERAKNWYFAYKIENGIIWVYDVEYTGNMSDDTFVSNRDTETDGNYNPQQQFSENKKRRPRTFIMSERQIRMIQEHIESSMKQGLPKSLLAQIYNSKTSLGNNPAFPPEDEVKFEEKLLLPAYEKVLSEINIMYPHLNKDNIDEYKNELSKLLKRCFEIEKPIQNELEQIVMKVVQKIFHVEDEDVDLTIEMVDRLTADDIKMSLLPEKTDDIEFDGIEDLHGINDDIYKRRMVNCLMQGFANRFIHLYELYIKDIFEINDELLGIYKRIITLNEYINFMDNANKADEDSMTYGSTSDIIVRREDKSKVYVKGVNFISLLHESIRAMLDLISINGLPDDTDKMKYILKKADFRYACNWDMRFGQAIWMKIEEKLGETEHIDILPYIFFVIVSKPTNEFNVFMQNIFANTKQGRIELNSMIDGIRYKLDQDSFEDELGKKREIIDDEKYAEV